MTVINGTTQLAGLIGSNIHFSKSFAMHNSAFSHLNINARYIPLPISRESIHDAIAALRAFKFIGVNVTMPFKELVVPYLDSLSEIAEKLGAVNTISQKDGKLIGDNTDSVGFIKSLIGENISIESRPVYIFGAGGSARAIAFALAHRGVRQFYISNRTEQRFITLRNMLQTSFQDILIQQFSSTISHDALIINCTPVGTMDIKPNMLWPEKIPFRPSQTVIDIVYEPKETPLLQKARVDGAQTLNGLGMLLHQAAESFSIWTNKAAPLSIMQHALMES
jgi:shikimate dehydrogenase